MKNFSIRNSLKLCGLAVVLSAAGLLTAHAQTTTLGNRSSVSTPNTALATNASATWSTYERGEDYAAAVTLPLKFITLSSGKKLAVYVSVPANFLGWPASGKFPVILTQTAYRIDLGELIGGIAPSDTTLLIGGLDKYMIKRGYITVAVDTYGTGASGGKTKLIGEEEQEAYGAAVDWVTKQSWFNGNIGLAGTSYLGITSLLTAEQQHPAVKAVFAEVPMGDPYRAVVATGGMINSLFVGTWMTLTQALSVLNGPAKLLNPLHYSTLDTATNDHVAAINDWYLPTFNNALGNVTGIATDDGTFWSVRSTLENTHKIKVPTFIVGSTNDLFQRDEPLLYERLKNSVNTKLAIVPGAHVQAILSAQQSNNNATSQGAPGSKNLLLQWFDQYLKGKNTGAASLPNVTQYVQGYGTGDTKRYATTTDWPHPQMKAQRMYLRGDMSLSNSAPTAAEATHTIAEPAAAPVVNASKVGNLFVATTTVKDSTDCSISTVQWTLGIAGLVPLPCFTDNTTVETKQNALIYQTPVLSSDMYLNGPIQADIWMSATNAQAALSIRVDDVDPSGKATPLTNGLQSAAYRAVDPSRSRYVDGVMIQPWHPFTAASSAPLVPGEAVLVPVEIFPTAALIRSGHRLRVAISSSNQAQGVWPLPLQTVANGNVSTIYNDPARPSSIVLPVVPASVLK
jgi:putative CocE/NonD family hydrolase